MYKIIGHLKPENTLEWVQRLNNIRDCGNKNNIYLIYIIMLIKRAKLRNWIGSNGFIITI